MPAAPWGRCWPRGSSFRTARPALPGSRWPRCSPSPCWRASGLGTSASTSTGPPVHHAPAVVARCPSRRVAPGRSRVLVLLIFSKYFYVASITSYFSFYLIEKFHVSVRSAQIHLFVFLLAMALGTLFGGPLGDRIGRKRVIWVSILGIAPFTLILPYVDLMWVGMLTFVIGLILSSAFSAIVVFAQELMPGNVGAVSGLFFGFAFGIGGIGAAVLGGLADRHGIEFVYRVCAYLPLLGMVAAFLPNIERRKR